MVQSQLKLKGTPTSALWGATIGFFFGVMAISLFGPTSTTLGAAMGLGATELGLLVSVPSLTGSLLRIPFGAMVDSNGGRRGFLFLLTAAVIGLGALSLLFTLYPVETPGSMKGLYPVVLLLGCLAGCGIATFSVEPHSPTTGLKRAVRAMLQVSTADWVPPLPAFWLLSFRFCLATLVSQPPTIF